MYTADLKEIGQMGAENKKSRTRPVHKDRYRLADLVRRITPKNRHVAFETGQPRGKEAW